MMNNIVGFVYFASKACTSLFILIKEKYKQYLIKLGLQQVIILSITMPVIQIDKMTH